MLNKLLENPKLTGLFIIFTLVVISAGSLFYNKKTSSNTSNEYFNNTNPLLKVDNSLTTAPGNKLERPILKIIVIADSHSNSPAFKRISSIIDQTQGVDLIVHLGDHTDYGDLKSLSQAKSDLDYLGIKYVALPGDRDLAASNSEENFYKYFKDEKSLNLKGVSLTFFNNSRNFLSYSDNYIADFIMKIKNTDYLFTSQPIYVDQSNFFVQKYMGSLEAFPDLEGAQKSNLERYSDERKLILDNLRKSEVKLVVSGDHHRSAIFSDPINKNLNYHIVGACAEKISLGKLLVNQESLQSQRVSLIEIYTNKNYKITEIELNEK